MELQNTINLFSNLKINNYKSKPCYNYKYCKNQYCSFAHSISELNPCICFTESNKGICENKNCEYKHLYETKEKYISRMNIKLPLVIEDWNFHVNNCLKEIENEIEIENKEDEIEKVKILNICKSSILMTQGRKELNNIIIKTTKMKEEEIRKQINNSNYYVKIIIE